MQIRFTKSFVRQLRKLEVDLIIECLEKIDLAKTNIQDPQLKTHPLHGSFEGCYSFSINYKYRVVFEYADDKQSIHLLAVGDHDVYKP